MVSSSCQLDKCTRRGAKRAKSVSNVEAVHSDCFFSVKSVIYQSETDNFDFRKVPKMKDLTHYFSDSFKASETPPAESKEVSVKSPKVAEVNQVNTKSKKTNSLPKKRGRKKKIVNPDSDNSKKTKCDLDIEKIQPFANGRKAVDNCIKEIPDTEGSPKNVSKENLNGNSSGNSDLKEAELSKPAKNEKKLNDGVPEGINAVSIDQHEEKEENFQNGTRDANVDINISDQTSEKVESETVSAIQEDKKKKRKEKIKVLAEKKGYAKRKLKEEEEAEEMEKKLQERKNAFTNVPKKEEDQPEIVHKPPAYSLLNYFSKATPESRQKEEAAKCKMSVKVEVHTPKEVTPNSTPNTTPKSQCSTVSQSKKQKAEIKQALSKMDEIQLISSESVTVIPPPVLEEKKKPNKPKWRIQFQSESFTDLGSEGEPFSPKSASKIQKENRNSVEVVNGKVLTLNVKENPSKSENSDAEVPKMKRKDRAAKHEAKRKMKNKSDTDEECIEIEVITKRKRKGKSDAEEECLEDKKKVSQKETKNTDSKVDVKNKLDNEVIIIEETLPKRSASEKIAPLFIKKRKLDPAVLEARRLFLQSDMSENENRPAKGKPSPVRNSVLPFPQISHVAQLDSDTKFETSEIKIQLKSPCNYCPSMDLSAFKNITNVNDSISKRCLTILDPMKSSGIEEALSEIESHCEDARVMWESISQTAKAESPKQTPKGRTSKRRAAAKKIAKTEEMKSIDDHDNVWIFKYKPMSTQEIVGNEKAAGKLKTWLDKWKIPVLKDDEDSDDDFYFSDCSSNYSSSDSNQVAILLGPHGCGKTASVYAVAEELGYTVLEINASSRRTGKRIFKELEEATKSHRIKKSGMKETFLKATTEEKKIPQNSLILMEDVDIIFEEDEGFVSAAFQLASNTKRPIVMTCNESCSHLNKLAPQQLHIEFQATTGNRALALLELISLAETGRKLSTSCIENLLESGDLRKALLQLQFLLAAGETYVLPPIIDIKHSSGISLWRKTQKCVYRPAVKSSKKQKKKPASQDSDARDVDILSQLADHLESVSLISKLIGTDDVSWTCQNSKSVMNLSLSEDTRPYSYSETISSSIAEFLTYETIQKKEANDSEQTIDKGSSKLVTRRQMSVGINSLLSNIASSTTDKRIITVDYLPSIRAICRAEETRNSLNNKRGNRFFHYLHGSKLPSNCSKIFSVACTIMQEKPDKV